MKKSIITVLIIFTVLLASSKARLLPRMTEITLAEPVFVIALDKTDENQTLLTLIYEKIESADESGENADKKYIERFTASSAAAALEEMKKRFPREIAASTADYFLIGEAAAKEDLTAYVDFLLKENTLRLTASVFIVKEASASEACEILTETLTLDVLRNFGENSGINAVSSKMAFYKLLSELAEPNRAVAVPALCFTERDGGTVVAPNGYAVVKNNELKGFLDESAARGLHILTKKSAYSAVTPGHDGEAVRINHINRTIKFDFNNHEFSGITINVNVSASVIQGTISENAEKALNRFIHREIWKAVNAAKTYESDFLGFGDALKIRHPYKWESYKDNWNEIFLNTPIIINVNSTITQT
ncbi:MAG: hypothetical protein FWG44_01365 [Oscillospiraceae bacterium]|nr:hypothetical protein [Oscillospiraceae bacterium]